MRAATKALIVGFVISVFVAWTLSLLCDPPCSATTLESRCSKHLWRFQYAVASGVATIRVDPIDDSVYCVAGANVMTVTNDMPIYTGLDHLPEADLPIWSRTIEYVAEVHPVVPGVFWQEEAYGWPCLCMRQLWYLPTATSTNINLRGGLPIGQMPRGAYAGRGLPIEPISIGILLNTACYGALVWLACSSMVAIRKSTRLRANRCPLCAYCLGTTIGCSECGWNRPTP